MANLQGLNDTVSKTLNDTDASHEKGQEYPSEVEARSTHHWDTSNALALRPTDLVSSDATFLDFHPDFAQEPAAGEYSPRTTREITLKNIRATRERCCLS